ncbi:helix-turn-helix transcriptional regulator [Clostridium botulinum]|nr:helix-turn-helix transcriptional regulator [Clostridium botulinum]NFS96492.1 helix-turn-helix transcriptional regulator [Clostridium botulinum]
MKPINNLTLFSLRKEHKFTLLQVANSIECSKQAYWNYEKGIRRLPFEKATKLSELYNVSLETIYFCIKSNQNVNKNKQIAI